MSRRGPKSERTGQKKPKSRSVRKEEVSNSENKSQIKKFEWVTVEERDEEGRLIIPRRAIKSTEFTFYNPEEHKDLKILILTGYAPNGAMLVSRKIYDIQKFDIKGWRANAEAIIELSPRRGHEKSWFDVFEGIDVDIQDTGLAGSISTEYKMKVTKTSFEKKVKTIHGNGENRLLEGRVYMKETYKSVWDRNKGKIFGKLFWILVAAIVGAIMGSLITLWVTNFFGD